MPKWKYIDQLETYDDRHQAFTNEFDNLLARCFGDNTLVQHKGDTVHVIINKKGVEALLRDSILEQHIKRKVRL